MGQDLLVFENDPHVENADALADWDCTALVRQISAFEMQREALCSATASGCERYPESPVFYGFRRILFTAKMFA
jgi:hypothetical protein